jgi:hypothetical protein
MTGFDEAALKRTQELTSKAKAGTKLSPAESLELKELKLLKAAAEIAKGRAEIAVAKRKIEDREKYRIGGLALAAGLNTWSDSALKVAFADLAAQATKPGIGNSPKIAADNPAGVPASEGDERLL